MMWFKDRTYDTYTIKNAGTVLYTASCIFCMYLHDFYKNSVSQITPVSTISAASLVVPVGADSRYPLG